jgi:hypothetical protein
MFPFELSPAVVTVLAIVLVALIGVAVWVALRDNDDDGDDGGDAG